MDKINTILVITKDKHLPKHITKIGSVLTLENITDAITIKEEDYDLVILGPPFKQDKVSLIPHGVVRVIEHPADLRKLLQEFVEVTDSKSKAQKLPYHEIEELLLLVTTDLDIIEELNNFNILIATNKYSALRHIEDISKELALIIWDRNTILAKAPKTDVPLLFWKEDVKDKKDIYLLLTTGQISIET